MFFLALTRSGQFYARVEINTLTYDCAGACPYAGVAGENQAYPFFTERIMRDLEDRKMWLA